MGGPEKAPGDGLAVAYLGLLAFIFAGVAALSCFAPNLMLAPLDEVLVTNAGKAEVRAAYGGLFGAAAFVYGLGSRKARWRGPALSFGMIVLGGFVFGRLVSLAMDGAPALEGWLTLAAEITGLTIAGALTWARRR